MALDDEIHHLIGQLYKAALSEDGWSETLQQIRMFLGGAGILLFYRNDETGGLDGLIQDCMPEEGLRDYAEHYIYVDPRVRQAVRAPEKRLLTDLQIVSESEMDRHEYYNWLSGFDGLRYYIGTRLFVDRNVSVLLAIQYTSKQHDLVVPETMTLLEAIIPHLENALRLNRQLNIQRTKVHGLLTAADTQGSGVIILNANQKIIFQNQAAENLTAQRDGLLIKDGFLVAADSECNWRLNRVLLQACRQIQIGTDQLSGMLQIERPSGKAPYSLLISPIMDQERYPGLREPAALVALHDPSSVTDILEERVAALYGLTPAEARLAVSISSGSSVRDYADRNSITENTVRTQLKQVFAKTETSGQVDLVRLLLSGPASLRI